MPQPKLLILGGAGMLGHKLFQILRERFPGTLATLRQETLTPPLDHVELLHGDDVIRGVDATDFPRLQGLLAEIKPDYILNGVGVIKQRGSAKVAIPSITINTLLPHQLAEFAAAWGGRVIHFSTDCVFSGRRGRYTEDDLSDAEDLYGKSKFLGEVAEENALTIRSSIIGRELTHHHSLLDWFLSQNHRTIRGYTKVIYSGITTNQMAETVAQIVQNHPTLHGLYQVASTPISKYDLLRQIRDAYGLEVDIQPYDAEVSDRSMLGTRFVETTGYVTPSWEEMIAALVADPAPYDRWLGGTLS